MKKTNCRGCYNDEYNHGLGGAKQCWSFTDAKIVWKKEVHVDQMPPFLQKAKRVPNCYHKQRYVYIDSKRIR